MTWMLTATGATVDLKFIKRDTISLLDIAHHLSQLNRYTGACVRPYSVAEHSLLCVEILRTRGETDPDMLQAALMHDAHEAYTADLSSPMKQVVGREWDYAEHRAARAVRERFSLTSAFNLHGGLIKHADMVALVTEREQLLPPSGPVWPAQLHYKPLPGWRFEDRAAFTWIDWRQAFIDEFANLQLHRIARGEHLVEEPEA